MNLAEYAKHVGRSKQVISEWIKPGNLLEKAHRRVGLHGRGVEIDVDMADSLLTTWLDAANAKHKAKDAAQYSLKDAQTKDKYLSVAIKKVQLDREKGILVLKKDMDKEAFECARITRDTILNVPDRISAILAAMTSEIDINNLLTKELTQALERVIKELEKSKTKGEGMNDTRGRKEDMQEL